MYYTWLWNIIQWQHKSSPISLQGLGLWVLLWLVTPGEVCFRKRHAFLLTENSLCLPLTQGMCGSAAVFKDLKRVSCIFPKVPDKTPILQGRWVVVHCLRDEGKIFFLSVWLFFKQNVTFDNNFTSTCLAGSWFLITSLMFESKTLKLDEKQISDINICNIDQFSAIKCR